MKLRKLVTVAGISAALVISGAVPAFAAATPNYDSTTPGAGLQLNNTPASPFTPGQAVSVTMPTGTASVQVWSYSLGRFLRADEFSYNATTGAVTLSDTFLRNNPGPQAFEAQAFDANGNQIMGGNRYINVVVPSLEQQGRVPGVRPVHPATGPAALVYGIGGLLLAGGGVSLVAAGKRRKAELV